MKIELHEPPMLIERVANIIEQECAILDVSARRVAREIIDVGDLSYELAEQDTSRSVSACW